MLCGVTQHTSNLVTHVSIAVVVVVPRLYSRLSTMSISANATSNSDVDSYYLQVALWPAVVYTLLLMTVGTVGNILVLIVYRRSYRRSVTRMFIFALAALDIGNCLITMPAELTILTRFTSFPSPVWCKVTRYLTYIFNGSSSIILIAIALDRYFKVCRPTHQGMDISRARQVCFGSFILAAILSIPALIIYGDMVIPVLVGDDRVSLLSLDHLRQNESAYPLGSSGTVIRGTFCLLTTEYMGSILPTMFYIGMLVLYLILIFFVIFFYSQVARTMFVLTRKHSMMFTFYTQRQSSSPHSAVLDDRQPSQSCGASNVVIREASTFDEDGPYEHCDRQDGVSTADDSHACDQDELSPRGRQKSIKGTPDVNSSRKDYKNSSVKSQQQNNHDQTNATLHPDTYSVDNKSHKIVKGSSKAAKFGSLDRNQIHSDVINFHSDINAVGSKKFRKSFKIPKIKVQDTSQSTEGLNHTSSMRNVDAKTLNVSSNSLLLRRIKSAENVNAVTKLNKLHMPEVNSRKTAAPVYPDMYEDLLPKVSCRKHRKDKARGVGDVGHVTKSCVNLDYVGGDGDKDAPHRTNSEKTLTLTRKTSPQGKKKICVLPLTGLSSKTVLLAQDSHNELNISKGDNSIKGSNSADKKEKPTAKKSCEALKVPTEEASDVTLRPKSPDAVPASLSSHVSVCSRKSQEGPKAARSPRQEIVSTADILQENHNRGSLHPFRTSRMLFTISLVFVISFLPFFIIALVRSSIGYTFLTSLSNAQLGVVSIFIRSSLINNAVNPIIYGLLSSHFRRECTGLVCCLWRK
ncbi:hypothetical protein Btru_004619 [Bulinus truncatus]|nr:hypothetical protein Btru_004619 [Bulinus truncatus]